MRPDLPGRALSNPFWWIGLVVVAISIIALVSGLSGRRERRAFLGIEFSYRRPVGHRSGRDFSRDASFNARAGELIHRLRCRVSPSTLRIGASFWWPVGLALAVFYSVFISRRYAGKVSVQRDTQGFY